MQLCVSGRILEKKDDLSFFTAFYEFYRLTGGLYESFIGGTGIMLGGISQAESAGLKIIIYCLSVHRNSPHRKMASYQIACGNFLWSSLPRCTRQHQLFQQCFFPRQGAVPGFYSVDIVSDNHSVSDPDIAWTAGSICFGRLHQTQQSPEVEV